MVDDTNNCKILHYGRKKCKRIACYFKEADIQVLVLGFDFPFLVNDLVEEIIGKKIRLEAIIGSKTIFNLVAKHCRMEKHRLQIAVFARRQSNEIGELYRIV